MTKIELFLPLPGGGLISYKEALSKFTIYAAKKRHVSYLLIPKQDQQDLRDIIIVATEYGIRICKNKGWPKLFVSKVYDVLECKDQKKFLKIDYLSIPTEIQESIIKNLINKIPYNQ